MLVSELRRRVRTLLTGRGAWIRRRRVVIPVTILAVYSLLGFLLAPALVRHYLPKTLEQSLGVKASIGEVRVNPFVLTLEAREFQLAERDGAPLAGFARLFVDLESSGLLRGAWTFADIRVEQAELDLVREGDGRSNLTRVLAAMPPSPEPADPDAPPPGLLIRHAEVVGARLRYTDRLGAQVASTEIGPVDLRLDEIATLPDHRGPHSLAATLPGGAQLAWEGQIGLHPLASTGTLRLTGFEPRAVWDFVQPLVALAPPAGVVDFSLGYEAGLRGGALQLRADPIALSVRGLAMQRPGADQPLLALESVELDGGRLELAEQTLTIPAVRIRNGRVAAVLDRTGTLDWTTLLAEPPVAPATAATPSPGDVAAEKPWRVELENLSVEGVTADVYDESRKAPLGFGLQANSVSLGASMVFGAAAPRIDVRNAAVDLADIALSTGAERAPFGRIARFTVEAASADLHAQRVQAGRIALQGIDTAIHREADGTIREVELASTPDPAVPLPVTQAAAEWQLTVGQLSLAGINASYSDAMTEPPIVYSVKDGRIALSNVQTGAAAPIGVEALLPLAEGGQVALEGSAAGDGSAAQLKLGVQALALAPLAPLVAQQSTLKLESGSLSSEATIDYRAAAQGPPVVQASATMGVDDLLLLESGSGERFLAWRSLAATGVEFGLTPDRLHVRELRLVKPGAKIVVFKDRTTNLAQVMREAPTVAQGEPPAPEIEQARDEPVPPPAAAASAAASAAEPLAVTIDRVRIDNGNVDFADHSLVLPFAARIEQLRGTVRGISSAANSRASLKLAGRVGEFGEAEIDGQLAPFDPTGFTDIEIEFRNIAMNQLSPYSATFAGREIASGDLDVGLEYRVEQRALSGDNRIMLQDFRLGDSVESAGAMDLPLDLAIALLTDAQGRIDLAVPVSGDVGDPAFSYGHLVGQALGNLLRGIVSAPFRALGSMFGGEAGSEELQTVRFSSGSAELMPKEQERIARVAEALAERPQLGVRLTPGIEPERDGYAVRRLQVRRAHAALLDIELEPGEDPGAVSYDGARSQRALELLLEAREGEDAADAFAAAFTARAGKEPERVNAALALLGRGEGDPAYYREMYLHLVRSTPEPQADLQALAAARVQTVRAGFEARGLAPDRVVDAPPAALVQAKPAGVLMPLGLIAVD